MKERVTMREEVTIGDLFNPGDEKASELFARQTPEKQQKLLRDLHAIAPHLVSAQPDGTFAPKDDNIGLYIDYNVAFRILDNGEPKIFTITDYAEINPSSISKCGATPETLEIKIQKTEGRYFLVEDDGKKSEIQFVEKAGGKGRAFFQTRSFNSSLDELHKFPYDKDGYKALDIDRGPRGYETILDIVGKMSPTQLSTQTFAVNYTALHLAAHAECSDVFMETIELRVKKGVLDIVRTMSPRQLREQTFAGNLKALDLAAHAGCSDVFMETIESKSRVKERFVDAVVGAVVGAKNNFGWTARQMHRRSTTPAGAEARTHTTADARATSSVASAPEATPTKKTTPSTSCCARTRGWVSKLIFGSPQDSTKQR